MLNAADFAVHQLLRPDYIAAKCRAQCLMSQAHPQNRPLAGETLDQLNADPRLLRRAWSRRNHDMVGADLLNFVRLT